MRNRTMSAMTDTNFDDPHESCRREIDRAYAAGADRTRIKQVIKQRPDGNYDVLQVLRVDMFQDGLRIVVR